MSRLHQGLGGVQDLTPAQKTSVAKQTARLLKDKKLARRRKVVIVFSAVLLVSPLDFVPEAIFGPLGLVDDAGYLATLVLLVLRQKAAGTVSKYGGVAQ